MRNIPIELLCTGCASQQYQRCMQSQLHAQPSAERGTAPLPSEASSST